MLNKVQPRLASDHMARPELLWDWSTGTGIVYIHAKKMSQRVWHEQLVYVASQQCVNAAPGQTQIQQQLTVQLPAGCDDFLLPSLAILIQSNCMLLQSPSIYACRHAIADNCSWHDRVPKAVSWYVIMGLLEQHEV